MRGSIFNDLAFINTRAVYIFLRRRNLGLWQKKFNTKLKVHYSVAQTKNNNIFVIYCDNY